jgi:hypothetical protein
MFHKTNSSFHLMPRLSDRSVVIKPVDPIYIPAGQRGTLSAPVMDCWLSQWAFRAIIRHTCHSTQRYVVW